MLPGVLLGRSPHRLASSRGLGGSGAVRCFCGLYYLVKQVSLTQTESPWHVALSRGREVALCPRLYATGKLDKALLLSKVSNQMGGGRGPGGFIQGAGGQIAPFPKEPTQLTSSGRPALINPFSPFL